MLIAARCTTRNVCAKIILRKILVSKVSNIVDFLEAGIRAESLRQKAIANNVANLQTPGYRRVDVKFEQLLAKSLDSDGCADLDEAIPELYQPKQTPVNSNGNDVSLEGEVGEMVKNTLRHKLFVRLLQKKYAAMQAAIDVK
jgi:flagellar basal-body rod protein FlgB